VPKSEAASPRALEKNPKMTYYTTYEQKENERTKETF
jgi:hypothetical protein